jgi:hypothetical protein
MVVLPWIRLVQNDRDIVLGASLNVFQQTCNKRKHT